MTIDICDDVATTTPATSSTTTATSTLVRRIGDMEVPAPGTWTVVRASHIALAPSGRRSRPVRQHIVDGAFEIDDNPERSAINVTLAGLHEMTFAGTPRRVVVNHHGMSEWIIDGTLTRDGRSDPMTFSISYHGVFRSSGRATAWFSGSGAVETPSNRPWWRPRRSRPTMVVIDLLLDRSRPSRSSSTEGTACTR